MAPDIRVPHILVFDSGVGGLTILDEIRQALPDACLSYAMDTANFPYGTKSESWLKKDVPLLLQSTIQESAADIVVVACNSASTVALPEIRQALDVPVVGTVPAVKPAAAGSQSNVIGLLATPGTVARQYTKDLIEEFAAHCKLLLHGSAELVDLAERKARGEAFELKEVALAIAPLFAQDVGEDIDTVVLACTHFPLLMDELERVAPRPLSWIDSGKAIAAHVATITEAVTFGADTAPQAAVYTTASVTNIALYRELFSARQLDRTVSLAR